MLDELPHRASLAWLGLACVSAASLGACNARSRSEPSAASASIAGPTGDIPPSPDGGPSVDADPDEVPLSTKVESVDRAVAIGSLPARPLFECSYANFGWGSVVVGNVLDENGRIWTEPRHGARWSRKLVRIDADAGAGGKWFDGHDARRRYANTVSTSRVEGTALSRARLLIDVARRGKITERQAGFDAGGCGCDAYVWHPERDAYQVVILYQFGNTDITNESDAARRLYPWARDLLGANLPREHLVIWEVPVPRRNWW